MTLETYLVAALLLAALWPVGSRFRSRTVRAALAVVLAAGVAGAWLWQTHRERQVRAAGQFAQKLPQTERPGGYVSSDSCRACHPDQYASWHRSFHRTMTQVASPAGVRGNFNDVTLELAGEQYHLRRRGDEFRVELADPDWKDARRQRERAHRARTGRPLPPEPNPPRVERRVTLTTGSHHMQAYWVAGTNGNAQFSLPFTYLFEAERWVPRNDVFLLDPATPPLLQFWNNNCLNCHTTAGQPGMDPRTPSVHTRVAEVGIACESCHGPAAAHVQANLDPRRRYALQRSGEPDPTILNPARLPPKKASEVCSQCHAIRYNDDEEYWRVHGFRGRPAGDLESFTPLARHPRPGAPPRPAGAKPDDPALLAGSFWSDGMVRVSGREFNGLVESGCFQRGELSCLSCHSMHQSEPDDQLAAGMEGNQACVQCHTAYANQPEKHTHHRPNSSGSLCYNCHMPHTTYGLVKAIRSHLIDSPTVQASLDTGRPNACNLCHLDQSLGWTARHLAAWYRQPQPKLSAEDRSVSAAVRWLLSGDAGQRALMAWHFGWAPAGEASGRDWLAPYLAQLLEDPYSVVRYIAQRSLKRLPGFETFAFDYLAPADERTRARQRALEIWQSQPRAVGPARSLVLLDAQGQVQQTHFARLLRQRNDRAMELLE